MGQFSHRSLQDWIHELKTGSLPDDRYRALLAVMSLATPEDAISCCQLSLRDADPGLRGLAAKRLKDLRQQSPSNSLWEGIGAELVERLQDEDPDVRFESARTLGTVSPRVTTARDLLLAFLDDDETQPLMLAHVVVALGERADVEIDSWIPRMRRLIAHTQAEVREAATMVAAKSGPMTGQLVPELILALDDEEPIVRENAATALGQGGTSSGEVIAALVVAAGDEDELVAAAAREAHQKLTASAD